MNRRNLIFKTAGIILLLVVTLILCFTYGPSRRIFVSPPETRNFSNNLDVLNYWHQKHLRGRVLYLFDRFSHIEMNKTQITNENYLDDALGKGMIRTVVHVVPSGAWQEVKKTLSSRSEFTFHDEVFTMPMDEGRLYVTTIDQVKQVSEPVLIVINKSAISPDEFARVTSLINHGVLNSDIVAMIGG